MASIAIFDIKATDNKGKIFHHTTEIYYLDIGDRSYAAGDDVDEIVVLTPDEIMLLSNRYEDLPSMPWYEGPEGSYSWADYAKMYGPIHRFVAEWVKKANAF